MEKYLNDLINQKQNIINILTSYGVSATTNERLNTLIPKLRSCVEYANAIQKTTKGNPIAIGDVSSVEHSLDVKLTSKNLLNPNIFANSNTIQGITFTNNGDGSITLNGTATAEAVYGLIPQSRAIPIKAGIYYTLSIEDKGSVFIQGRTEDESVQMYLATPCVTKKFEKDYRLRVNIRVKAGTTCENVIIHPQLELGSTATAYTPYRTEFDGVEVSRCGKNLFDVSKFKSTSDGIYTNNGDGTITITSYGTESKTTLREVCPLLKVGDVATLSLETQSHIKMMYLAGAKTTWNSGSAITITEDMLNSKLVLYSQRIDGVNSLAIASNIQIELGKKATEYEPYAEPQTATANIDGTVEGLRSVSPNMTLMSDNSVIIDCAYNTDTKTYIDNKALALQMAVVGG